MYNLRYHIASIVGIFLALALGLLLGAAIGGSEALRNTSEQLVSDLRSEFSTIREERDALKSELEVTQDFSAEMVGSWGRDRLIDRHIVVLSDSGSTITSDRVTATLEQMGATVTVVVLKDAQAAGQKNTSLLQKLESQFKISLSREDQAPLTAEVARALVSEWQGAGTKVSSDQEFALQAADNAQAHQFTGDLALTKLLQDEGVLSLAGEVEQWAPVDGIVNLAIDADKKPMISALEIAASAAAQKIPVVLTQAKGQDEQMVIEASSRGFSASAAVDSYMGSYSMVALLIGAEKGTYGLPGMKPYPPLETPDHLADQQGSAR